LYSYDRLGREPFSGAPGGNHIDLVLHDEFPDGCLRFRHLIGRIDGNHGNLVARHAAFDIVDVLEIVPLSLFMEFAPAGRRAGEIDRRTDLDRFGLGRRRSRREQQCGAKRQYHSSPFFHRPSPFC